MGRQLVVEEDRFTAMLAPGPAASGRAGVAAAAGGAGAVAGPGRDQPGGRVGRGSPGHGRAWRAGVGGRGRARRAGAGEGCWAAAGAGVGPGAGPGAAGAGGPRDSWGPAVGAAVDDEVDAASGRGAFLGRSRGF